MQPQLRGFLIILTMLMLAACASQPAPPKADLSFSDGAFPSAPELRPQVGFWRQVYASW